jgi:hypothetical protein
MKNKKVDEWLNFHKTLFETGTVQTNPQDTTGFVAADIGMFAVLVLIVFTFSWFRARKRIKEFFRRHGLSMTEHKERVSTDEKGHETRRKYEVTQYPSYRVTKGFIELWNIPGGSNLFKLDSLRAEVADAFGSSKIGKVEEVIKRPFPALWRREYRYRFYFDRLPKEVLPKTMPRLSKYSIWIGVDSSGKNIFEDLRKVPTYGVFGPIRSGKSIAIRAMIASTFLSSPTRPSLIVVDEKGNDYTDLIERFEGKRYGTTTDQEFTAAVVAVESIVQELDRFKGILDQNGVQVESWHQIRELRTDLPVPPFYFLVCDELAQYCKENLGETKDRKQLRERFVRALGKLLAVYRYAGILIVLGTQESTRELELSYTNLIGKLVSRQSEEMSRRITGGDSRIASDPTLTEGKMVYISPYNKVVVRTPYFALPRFNPKAFEAKFRSKT